MVNLLKAAGHDVLTVNEVESSNRLDQVVLDYAKQNKRILLTRNCDDFQELHQTNSSHSGILAIYQATDSSKNMSYQAIVKAIANLETTDYLTENQFIVLNQWSY